MFFKAEAVSLFFVKYSEKSIPSCCTGSRSALVSFLFSSYCLLQNAAEWLAVVTVFKASAGDWSGGGNEIEKWLKKEKVGY